jgi:DNA-binding transcriptional regulator GbsR (MarR family)
MTTHRGREAALAQFVEAWGGMSSLFGFNPSTARVSALLIGAVEPQSLSQIAERLGISRGNASMCLKELRGWGVAQRVSLPGDRQDYYVSRGDLFRQTLSIARERKRREFDPAAQSAVGALDELALGAGPDEAARIEEIRAYVATIDRIGREVLENETAALALIALLRSSFGGGGEGA